MSFLLTSAFSLHPLPVQPHLDVQCWMFDVRVPALPHPRRPCSEGAFSSHTTPATTLSGLQSQCSALSAPHVKRLARPARSTFVRLCLRDKIPRRLPPSLPLLPSVESVFGMSGCLRSLCSLLFKAVPSGQDFKVRWFDVRCFCSPLPGSHLRSLRWLL